jgi:hypothetical protein
LEGAIAYDVFNFCVDFSVFVLLNCVLFLFYLFSLFFLFSAGTKSEGLTFHADPNYDPTQGKIYFVYAFEQ